MVKSRQQFQDQGGIATSNPNFIRRWVISKLMTMLASEKRMQAKRDKAEQQRIRAGRRHVIEYFHQVDDGYSHLSTQVLTSLVARYDIELRIHVVNAPTGLNVAEPALLSNLGLSDAKSIAQHYDLTFPDIDTLPCDENIHMAQAILVAQEQNNLPQHIATISAALWRNDKVSLQH